MAQHPFTAPLVERGAGRAVRGGAPDAVAVGGVECEDLDTDGLASLTDDALVAISEEEVARARRGGDRRHLAECLAASGRAHMAVADIPAARQRFLECLAVGRRRGEELVAQVHVGLVAQAHVGLGWAALVQGDYGAAAVHLELALALTTAAPLDTHQARAAACLWSADLAARRGEHELARGHYQLALGLATAALVPCAAVPALVGLARLAVTQGDLDAAGRLCAEAWMLARQGGDASVVALCLEARGALASARGEGEAARELLGRAAALARRHHDPVREAAATEHLGRLARAEGDLAAAADAHQRALALRAGMGDRAGVAESLEALGRVGVGWGQCGPGLRLMAAAHALRHRLGHPRPAADNEGYGRDLAAAREALGHPEFDGQWAAGMRLRAEEAVAVAACAGFGGPTNAWDALSPAECRVVEAVGEGLTNAEIAQRLAISPHTVRHHLRQVFAKLGLPTRAALLREVQAR